MIFLVRVATSMCSRHGLGYQCVGQQSPAFYLPNHIRIVCGLAAQRNSAEMQHRGALRILSVPVYFSISKLASNICEEVEDDRLLKG
jgi:hypothetical protein